MRSHVSRANLRAFAVLGALVTMTACSGGGSSGTSPVPNTQFCGNDAQYALARPQTGLSISAGTGGTVEIVASGNNNQIYNSFKNFELLFVPANNNGSTQGQVITGPLSLTSDSNGYAPFTSNYYYNGTIANNQSGLISGVVYNVYLNAFTTNCTPVGPIGQLGAQ